MTKLRVYEYAKQLNMSSKEIITILSRLNIPVNNHMSVMEAPMVVAVEGFFSDVKARAATRSAAEQERQQIQQQAREAERRKAQMQLADQEREAHTASTDEQQGMSGERRVTKEKTEPMQQSDRRGAAVAEAALADNQEAVLSKSEDNATHPVEAAPTDRTVGSESANARQTDENVSQITGARPNQSYGERPRAQSSQRPPYAGQQRSTQSGYKSDRPDRSGTPSDRSGSQNRSADRPGSSQGQQRTPRPYEGGQSGDRSSQSGSSGGYQGRSSSGGYASGSRPPSTGGSPRPYGGGYRSGGQGSSSQGGQGGGYRSGGQGGQSQGGQGGQSQGGQGGGGYRSGGQGGQGQGQGQGQSGGYRSAGAGARPQGGGYGQQQGDAQRPAGGGASFARSPDRRGVGTGAGAGRPDNQRSGGSGGGGRNFGAPASSSAGGNRFAPQTADQRSNSAGAGRKRGLNDRNTGSRNPLSEKRENNRKLQPPRSSRSHGRVEQVVKAPEGPRQVTVDSPMTVGEFAHYIRREASEVIKKLLFLGTLVTINQEIDTETMALVGSEFGTEVKIEEPRNLEEEEMLHELVDAATLEHRPPVVTIMGHVDHGKTTLLDTIRETNVTASEAGGITQHIGAYQVEIKQKKITFLDTPGHAAFTTMRARGAQITDITVLVVAADDGVMPQTVEAIHHAKAANVPIIVAVNKIDKPGANLERIKQELTEHGLVAEEWGGDTIFVPISALLKQGIEELLEMILLVAEVGDLKASMSTRARGTVIEAELDKGRGPVATVLVQNGTLRVGDIVVAGNTYGRVRAMVNDRGRRVKEAISSMPVEIVGLSDVPSAGDLFVVYDDERQARVVSERRTTRQRVEELGSTARVTLDDLYKQIQEGEIKDLNLILKADVHGSAEAVLGALQKIAVSGVRIRVLHSGVGAITESDILLASASNAIVLGFNVRPEPNAVKVAETEKVDVRLYRVIYNLVEEIEAALKGMLDPVYKEVVLGRAEIRQLFKVSKVGTIAGAMVQEGKLVRDAEARLIRSGVIVHEGRLDSLKRFKDDAKEVAAGYECGVTLERFNDIKEGDIVEVFKMEAIKE